MTDDKDRTGGSRAARRFSRQGPAVFAADLMAWKRYTAEIHERDQQRRDLYVDLLWWVQCTGHRTVAEASCGRTRLLEIGVGGGEHVPFELDAVRIEHYVAVDTDPVSLVTARRKYPWLRTILADAARLPFHTASFTAAIALSVLEHIVDLDRFLSDLRRVLAPGGAFLVVVPANGCLSVEVFKRVVTYPSLRRRGIRHPSWIWSFGNCNSLARIEALLHRHFTVVESRPLPWRWLPAWLAPLQFFHCVNDE